MTRDQLESALDGVGLDDSDKAYVLMKFDQAAPAAAVEPHTFDCPALEGDGCDCDASAAPEGLTDKQIDALGIRSFQRGYQREWREFARAIEAFHGIGDQP